MAQRPINPEGGEAYPALARLPREDAARVIELAASRGTTRSAVLRGLPDVTGLRDQLEV
jgi:hypothetical protein